MLEKRRSDMPLSARSGSVKRSRKMGKFNKTKTVRDNLFEDETSEIGKARVARFHRRMDELSERLERDYLRRFPDMTPPRGSGQE